MGSTGWELALRVGTSLPSSTPLPGGAWSESSLHQETWAFLVPSRVSLRSALGNEPCCLLPDISKVLLER